MSRTIQCQTLRIGKQCHLRCAQLPFLHALHIQNLAEGEIVFQHIGAPLAGIIRIQLVDMQLPFYNRLSAEQLAFLHGGLALTAKQLLSLRQIAVKVQ